MFERSLWQWATLISLTLTAPTWGQEPPNEPGPTKARVDLYGDPLPDGAIARLGSVRFRHYGAVHSVAFSEDGKLLAASSDDRNMVVIWERATGRKLREISVGDRYLPPTSLRFSPDGRRLYSSPYRYDADTTLYARDVETGADARGVPRLPAGTTALVYSADMSQAILFHKEPALVRWDIDNGKELGRYPKPDGNLSIVAMVGERILVPVFDERTVVMWDVTQTKKLWSVDTTRQKEYPGLPMDFSADGRLFAVEAPPKTISVYDSVTGTLVRRLEADVGKIYWSVRISSDRRTIAGSNWDGSLRLWDLESGRERAKLSAIEGSITYVFFAPDSKTFATGGPNNAHGVQFWDTATGKRVEPFPGHSSPIASLAFSPDGRAVATSSNIRGDPVIRLWDPATGRPLSSFQTPSPGGVSAVAFSPDGTMLASCGWWWGDYKVRLWDIRSGRERHGLAGHEAGCTCVAFSPDGKLLASGDAARRGAAPEGRLRIWNTDTGKLVHEIQGTPGSISRVLFTRDGRHVLAAAVGVQVYETDSGKTAGAAFLARSQVSGLALSADGRLVATAHGRGRVRLWELATRREIPITCPDGEGYDVDITPDGRCLVASGLTGGRVVFDWPSGQIVGRMRGVGGSRARVAFSPDGSRLATAVESESAALIWDVAGLVKRPLPAVPKPTEADLQRWWEDLRDESPGNAYQAVWRFTPVPEQALPFLAATLRPIKTPELDTVGHLIGDLDSADFDVREKASRELEQLADAVEEALQKAKKGKMSPEQARRIGELLAKLAGPVPAPEQLRAIRAVATLEQIGGPEVRKVLARLAAGAPGAVLTRNAKAALERVKPAHGSK
jgi:WD40 repeat protein